MVVIEQKTSQSLFLRQIRKSRCDLLLPIPLKTPYSRLARWARYLHFFIRADDYGVNHFFNLNLSVVPKSVTDITNIKINFYDNPIINFCS
jgi:hypothetical protein